MRTFPELPHLRQRVLRVNAQLIERAAGGPYTARSINTVQRLLLKSS